MTNVKSAIETAEEYRRQAITDALKEPMPRPPRINGGGELPTIWTQCDTMVRALADVSNHCRRTATDLEQRLMELERMLGSMPKRP